MRLMNKHDGRGSRSIPSLCLAGLTLVAVVGTAPLAHAAMGLGADARPAVAKWAAALDGLKVTESLVERSRAVVQLGPGCRILLAHSSGTDCAGLHMDVGNTRACLDGTSCPEWPAFQAALGAAGPLFLPWRPAAPEATAAGAAPPVPAAATAVPSTVAEALVIARQRLILGDRAGAQRLLTSWIDGTRPDKPTELMSLLPVLAHVGAGRAAAGVLGREGWTVEHPTDFLVRLALQLGPALALAAAELLVESYNACEVVPLAEGFYAAGAMYESAMLARVARREDPSCWPAYLVETQAWERLERATSIGTVYNAAKVAFPEDTRRLTALGARTFVVRRELKPAMYALELMLSEGARDSRTVGAAMDLMVHPDFKRDRAIKTQTQLESSSSDVLAAVFGSAIAFDNRDYRRAYELADRALLADPRLQGVAQLKMVSALSAFELGDAPAARRAVAAAERAGPEDPRVLAARAEVWRDDDPMVARRGLEAALRASRDRPSLGAFRASVIARLAAVKACADTRGEGPCAGPWEHHFGAASKPAPKPGARPADTPEAGSRPR